MQDLFFELIRVAIVTQHSLSRLPSAKEWDEIFELAKKQSLVGVTFFGIQKFGVNSENIFATIGLNEETYYIWAGMATQINIKNEQVDRQCAKVQEELGKAGFESCILKGQGVASYYGDLSGFRQTGDIDVWVNSDCHRVMEYVNKLTPNREFDRKHTHLNAFVDTSVEIHWFPSVSANPFVNKRLKAFYHAKAATQMSHKVALGNGLEIVAPDGEFHCIHLMLHLYGHFLYEGIGLRQLMDIYFAMKTPLAQETKHCIVERYRDFKVYDFACGINWVIMYVFGERDCLLCEPNEKLGRELLKEIMEGGNFGKHSKENKVKDESFSQRMMRRLKRRSRLMKYSPWNVLLAPFRKVQFLMWKQYMIMKYKL